MSEENPFDDDSTALDAAAGTAENAATSTDAAAPVIKDGEPEQGTAAKAEKPQAEAKPKRKRRTKAQVEADRASGETEADSGEKTPLSEYYDGASSYDAVSNEVAAGVKLHNGIPVAWVRPKHWVGDDPLVLGLEELRDVQAVASDLIAQLQGAK